MAVRLCCRIRNREATVWSEKILSNTDAMSPCHWVLTFFLGEGGKFKSVEFISQLVVRVTSFNKGMAKKMSHVLECDPLSGTQNPACL